MDITHPNNTSFSFRGTTKPIRHIGYFGPIDSRFGYGRGGITILRALTMLSIEVAVTPYYDGKVGSIPYVQDLMPDVMNQLGARSFSPWLELMHCPPDSYYLSKAPFRIGWTMWETDQIPNGLTNHQGDWAMLINKHCKALIVPSEHNRAIFSRCGVEVPISVIPYGVDSDMWPQLKRAPRDKFDVLLYGDLTTRKGVFESVQAFKLAFPTEKDVQLILKTQKGQLGLGLYKVPEFNDPRIMIINETWDHFRLLKLLHDTDCFIWLSRGEGFGFPPLEATLTNLPVVMTYHTGMEQYYRPEFFYGVPTAGTSPSPQGGNWYEPDLHIAAFQLRSIYENRESAIQKAELASEYARLNFSLEILAKRLSDFLAQF